MSGSPAVSTSSTTVDEPPEQRRTLAVLLLAQILSGAGLAAGITVGALLAEQMLGSSRLSGLPTVFFTIGSAAAAVGLGRAQPALRPARGSERWLSHRRCGQFGSGCRGLPRQRRVALCIAADLWRRRCHQSASPLCGSGSCRAVPARASREHRARRNSGRCDSRPQFDQG